MFLQFDPIIEEEGDIRATKIDEDREKADHEISRPPVVAVMGHVDHGKTTLLDTLRGDGIQVAEAEAGHITQTISAFSVPLDEAGASSLPRWFLCEATVHGVVIHFCFRVTCTTAETGDGVISSITFIDTPGHGAFKTMRERVGAVTDVAILVVSARDGFQEQTLKSIELLTEEDIPFIVAVTKVDLMSKHDLDIALRGIESDLMNVGFASESDGGDVQVRSPGQCIPSN